MAIRTHSRFGPTPGSDPLPVRTHFWFGPTSGSDPLLVRTHFSRYLLDTNILSNLVRHPQGGVARHIADVGEEMICTSIIVAAELRFGAAKRNAPRLTDQVEAILGVIEVLPFDSPADRAYAQLRCKLEKVGLLLGQTTC